MNLQKPDGYFCYVALMVPSAKLLDLQRFWSARRAHLTEEYKRMTGYEIQGEFKSGYLKKLGFPCRQNFGERLGYFLRKNKCFVAGFYTTVQSFLLYNLRTTIGLDDVATQLPKDWANSLAGIKERFLREKPAQPGESNLLLGLFHQTLSITLNWMGSLKCSFQVVYDPRQKKEDAFLIRFADEWLKQEAAVKKLDGVYMGATAAITSSQSPGLMLADLILRDARFVFDDIPELLTERSGIDLVLPIAQGCEPVVMSLKGTRMKWGNRRPMSPQLRQRLARPSPNSMMPLYFDSLADQKLSCNAAYGESRVLNFGLRCIEDMVD